MFRSDWFVAEGPRFVEQLRPNTVTSVEDDVTLRCHAQSEEILDVAYIWTHNGLRIRDTDLIHTRFVSLPRFRVVAASFLYISHYVILRYKKL